MVRRKPITEAGRRHAFTSVFCIAPPEGTPGSYGYAVAVEEIQQFRSGEDEKQQSF